MIIQKGYKNNCVACCKVCNYAKSNIELKAFQKWAIRLGKNAMAEQWGNPELLTNPL